MGAISDGTKTFFDNTGNRANMSATQKLRRILEDWHAPAATSVR